MKTWDVFLPDVLPYTPGLAEPAVERGIMRAAQDFCTITRAWRVVLDPTTLRANKLEYDIELEPRSELVRIESATLDGVPITVWRAGDDPCVRCIYSADGKSITLSQAASDGQKLVVTATLKPANGASGIEDSLYDQYVDTIAKGAIARLRADMAGTDAFEAACNRIKTRLWRGQAATRPRAIPRFF